MRVRKITKTWMLLVGTVVLCLTGCGKETQTADFSGGTSVCELATLKCYYHNVAKAETEASGIFAKWLKTGYKKIWTEYSGIIEYGIDISQVTVSEPDKNGVVTVTLPDAQVGDVLVFHNIGAYSVTEGIYLFLSRRMPKIFLYGEKDGLKLLRNNTETWMMNTWEGDWK